MKLYIAASVFFAVSTFLLSVYLYLKKTLTKKPKKPWDLDKPPLMFFRMKSTGLYQDLWEIIAEFEIKHGRPPYKLEVG